jgi:PEP-CTERM motif
MIMRSAALKFSVAVVPAIALVLSVLGLQNASAFDQDDIILGRSESFDSFRVYHNGSWGPGPGWHGAVSTLAGDYNGNFLVDAADYTVWRDAVTATSSTLPNRDPTKVNGTDLVDETDFDYWRGRFGFHGDLGFIQSVEFDNSGGISHNGAGNLLGANYGAAFTGFEIYNFATDGSSTTQSLFSIVDQTGGTKGTDPMGAWLSDSGGGISVSPGNDYVAWADGDSGQIYVLDYHPGSSIGTGTGASLDGPRRTKNGNYTGGDGPNAPLFGNPSGFNDTQGTAWLNDTTVVAFNSYGEIITWDVSAVGAGSQDGTMVGFLPTEASNWIRHNVGGITAQFTDVEYNPLVDEDHIFAAATLSSDFSAHLYAFDYDPDNEIVGALVEDITVPLDGTNSEPQEPREIALDTDGNLFYSGYAGSGGDNIIMKFPNATTTVGAWDPNDVEVFYRSSDYTGFNGMDIAVSLPFPLGAGAGSGAAAVPEPGSLGLLVIGLLGLWGARPRR